MRRFFLPLLVLALCLAAASALAAPNTPYAPATILYTQPLTEQQMDLLSLLYDNAKQGIAHVELPPNTAYEDVRPVMQQLGDNFP